MDENSNDGVGLDVRKLTFVSHFITLFICFLPSDSASQAVRWDSVPPPGQTSRYPQATMSCSPETPPLTPSDSLGPIQWGMPLGLLEERCEGFEYDWIRLEGEPVPVLLTLLGEMSVVVEFADTLPGTPIYRISTNSESARTLDGIGPGVELITVARLWPDLKIAFGEGAFALSATHSWISLGIGMPGEWDWEAAQKVRRTGDWSALPEGSYVESVLLLRPHIGRRDD